MGANLYYTSGMESFYPSMETNALMGKNVARLIVDDIVGASSGGGGAGSVPVSGEEFSRAGGG